MCQACERSRHSVVTTASRRLGAGCARAAEAASVLAPTALVKVRRVIMVAPLGDARWYGNTTIHSHCTIITARFRLAFARRRANARRNREAVFMKRLLILSAMLLTSSAAIAQDNAPDWVKVTDKAGWQARDSQ